MCRLVRWALLPALLLGGFVRPASADVRKDEADFFSRDAVKRADQRIQQMKDRTGIDLVIETFAKPDEDPGTTPKAEFFPRWANRRAKAIDVQGVYVLICRRPSFL